MRRCARWSLLLFLHLQLHAIHAALNENLVCDDFYAYACAGWQRDRVLPHSEPFWSVFTDTAQRIATGLRAILHADSERAVRIDDERRMYAACTADAGDYTSDLNFVVNKLGGVQHASPKNTRYDYFLHIIEVTKLLNIHPILKFHVKQNMLHIERGDFIFPEVFLIHAERFHVELNIYMKWIENAMLLLHIDSTKDMSTKRARKFPNFQLLAKEIVAFEVKLARLPHKKPIKINAKELAKTKALHFLLGDVLNQVHEVFIDEVYLDSLGKLIESVHWRHASNYIIWNVVKELSRNINPDFRRLSFEVDRQLLGVTEDISRGRECIDETIKYIGSRNLQENFHIVTKQPKAELLHEVKIMANEIRNSFLTSLQGNKLFSNKAKAYILKKIEDVKFEIGSPVNMQQEKYTPEWNYFKNLLHLKAKKFDQELKKLTQNESIEWPGSIFEVNAFYSPSQNAIILPLGILQAPFFDLSQTAAENYGALGALIGHEFSHVLDNLDHNALTPSDIHVLRTRMNCGDTFSTTRNDPATANENVADMTGIRLSYFVFLSKYSNDLHEETEEEVFFLSYAKMWCELNGNERMEILGIDEHAPVAMRVKTTLKSFPQFAKTFNCFDLYTLNGNDCFAF